LSRFPRRRPAQAAEQAAGATETSSREYRLFPATSSGTALHGGMVIAIKADGAVPQFAPQQEDPLLLSVPLLL
jgi:hypothetical protein